MSKQLTEVEKEAQARALSNAYRIVLKNMRDRDRREFVWAKRPVPWAEDEAGNMWTCDLPTARAIVLLTKDLWFWEVCIERRTPGKSGYNRFFELADAVTWAEEQLTMAATEEDEAEGEAASPPAPSARRSSIDLEPYRIDPSALKPERITYQVVVEMDAAPERFKTMEMLCGRELRYDERYLSPSRLAAELRIDPSQLELEQPIGPNNSWNRGASTTTYYRESIAMEQAQALWNNSRIVEHYRNGKLERARYGVQEVETGYVSWLGGCENPEKPWEKYITRTEYMAVKAEELTLVHALDVEGFREFARLPESTISDERILSLLHHRRAKSSAIPGEARAESQRWLLEHSFTR